MTQTYTSDHHLVIEINDGEIVGDYKGHSFSGKVEEHLKPYLEDIFSDLNRQHENTINLRAAVRALAETAPEELKQKYLDLVRRTY